jgi:acyl dehydratase
MPLETPLMLHPTFEQFEIDQTITSYGRTVTETDVMTFVGLAGIKAPLFIDAEFSRRHSPYGGRIVPGLLTLALSAGMMEEILGPHTLAALGLNNVKFTQVVKVGDTLTTFLKVVSTRQASDQRRGILGVRVEVRNQREEAVVSFDNTFLMKLSIPDVANSKSPASAS